MSKWITPFKDWLPAIVAAWALIVTTGYALSRKAHAAEGIRQMSELAAMMSNTAHRAQDNTLSQKDIEELKAVEGDLRGRMADALEPSLVQADLMQSASKAGLLLRDIRPLLQPHRTGGEDQPAAYPRYRVCVTGAYRQIAEYMQLCSRQRLPVRATEFRLRRTADEDGMDGARLSADITVEAFWPRDHEDKEAAD